jgi:hypothetical protein
MIQGNLNNASKKDTTLKGVAIADTVRNTEQAFTWSPIHLVMLTTLSRLSLESFFT